MNQLNFTQTSKIFLYILKKTIRTNIFNIISEYIPESPNNIYPNPKIIKVVYDDHTQLQKKRRYEQDLSNIIDFTKCIRLKNESFRENIMELHIKECDFNEELTIIREIQCNNMDEILETEEYLAMKKYQIRQHRYNVRILNNELVMAEEEYIIPTDESLYEILTPTYNEEYTLSVASHISMTSDTDDDTWVTAGSIEASYNEPDPQPPQSGNDESYNNVKIYNEYIPKAFMMDFDEDYTTPPQKPAINFTFTLVEKKLNKHNTFILGNVNSLQLTDNKQSTLRDSNMMLLKHKRNRDMINDDGESSGSDEVDGFGLPSVTLSTKFPNVPDHIVQHTPIVQHNHIDEIMDMMDIPIYNFEVSTPRNGLRLLKYRSYGLVIYGDSTIYSKDNNENKHIHIPVPKEDIMKVLRDMFNNLGNVKNIIVGHEHGDSNNKCHYQIFAFFTSKIEVKQYIYTLYVNGHKLHMMLQGGNSIEALKKYCKKNNDFCSYQSQNELLDLYDTDKQNVFNNIAQKKHEIKPDEALSIIFDMQPRFCMASYRNVKQCLDEQMIPSLPPFTWSFPNHLIDKYNGILYRWYLNECIPIKERRIGLLIYSSKRKLGKSKFVRSLVNDSRYVLEFNNCFNSEAFIGKSNARLVHLEDMTPPTSNNYEAWKALITGQSTNLRAAYTNKHIKGGMPCIITTNNKLMLGKFLSDPNFNTSLYFVDIKDSYMGPPGTEPVIQNYIMTNIEDELIDELINQSKENDRRFRENNI